MNLPMNSAKLASLLLLPLAMSTSACGDDVAPADDTDAGTVGADGTASDGADGSDTTTPISVTPIEGLWRMNFAVVEAGGLEIPFQAELTNMGSAADGSLTVTWQLRAYDAAAGEASDVLGTADAVPFTADGSFVADFGDVALPGQYSPTGSMVTLGALQLAGQFSAEDAMCGTVSSLVIEIDLMLSESTFGASPWDSGITPSPNCDGGTVTPLSRIDPSDCPAFDEGFNGAFPSADLARELYVYTPTDADTAGPWPVVFAYHGLGGSADWVTVGGDNDLITPIDSRGYILVSPESQAIGGTEWQQGTTDDNEDLVFFDDILTCLDAQYGIDDSQIYVTGMSAGGLYTSYLGVVRDDAIAAAAPLSGGFIAPYVMPDNTRPYLVTWGGTDDFAFEQDFDTLAMNMMADLAAGGHFYASCDHGMGHVWPMVMTEPVLDFLFAHPRGTDPSPYATALPGTFPAFCTLP
jgi:predicted esterase